MENLLIAIVLGGLLLISVAALLIRSGSRNQSVRGSSWLTLCIWLPPMVVAFAVLVLPRITIPSKYKGPAMRAARANTIRQLGQALSEYAQEFGSLPQASDPVRALLQTHPRNCMDVSLYVSPGTPRYGERREALKRLRFPLSDAELELIDYAAVTGANLKNPRDILVYERVASDGTRWVARVNGDPECISEEEFLKTLPQQPVEGSAGSPQGDPLRVP